MSIFVNKDSRVAVQGVTGKEGSFWTRHMKEMGTQVVFGVTPGKEGQDVAGVPVYHSVRRGMREHPADVAMLFVPPRFTKDAIFEALDAGIRKICATADGIPLHESVQIRKAALSCGAMVVGGNTTGIISVGEALLGIIPYWIDSVYKKGHVGVMTRSGSLTNEVTAEIIKGGFGVTTLVGVGGDPVPGTRFAELLPMKIRTRMPWWSSASWAAAWKRRWPRPWKPGCSANPWSSSWAGAPRPRASAWGMPGPLPATGTAQ